MILTVVALFAGVALMGGSWISHRRMIDHALDEAVGMTAPPRLGRSPRVVGAAAGHAARVASRVVEQLDRGSSLGKALESAKIDLRPGEFVVVNAGFSAGAAAAVLATTHVWMLAAMAAGGAWLVGYFYVRRRIRRRRRAFEAQLPDALSLIASSLSAGHTFLRAIQMMCEESGPPLSEEFGVVVSETRLGDSLVDALARMAERLQVRDLDIVVEAIRVQQTVGGRLADLLHTLSDFIRARAEVRREVNVLTAEGRMSAYVLTGLVPFLFTIIQVLNPDYIKPLFSGIGLFILGGSAISVVVGLIVILRMVTIDF